MKKNLFFTSIILAIILLISNLTKIDIWIQDLFFRNNNWLIDRNDLIIRRIFYQIPKFILALIGIVNIIIFATSFYKKSLYKLRSRSLIIFFAIILVPLMISSLKKVTNLYCPSQLSLYNGDKPLVRLFDKYPKDFLQDRPGRCYPAGHASGGFALLSLYYVMKHRYLGILIGGIMGWTMGLYQILSGSHFISDTIISMLLAWLIVSIIAQLSSRY